MEDHARGEFLARRSALHRRCRRRLFPDRFMRVLRRRRQLGRQSDFQGKDGRERSRQAQSQLIRRTANQRFALCERRIGPGFEAGVGDAGIEVRVAQRGEPARPQLGAQLGLDAVGNGARDVEIVDRIRGRRTPRSSAAPAPPASASSSTRPMRASAPTSRGAVLRAPTRTQSRCRHS